MEALPGGVRLIRVAWRVITICFALNMLACSSPSEVEAGSRARIATDTAAIIQRDLKSTEPHCEDNGSTYCKRLAFQGRSPVLEAALPAELVARLRTLGWRKPTLTCTPKVGAGGETCNAFEARAFHDGSLSIAFHFGRDRPGPFRVTVRLLRS